MKIGENNFVQQLQLHNEKALLYVVDQYGSLLMSVIRKHLFTLPERQEECLNDVLLKIWENINSFDEAKNSFKNWAAAVARYRSIDYLRSSQREVKQVSLEDTDIPQEDAVLASLIEREISDELERMLGCLKPADKKLFLKLYVEEESIEQVSREMAMDKTIIYNRVSRAKKKIRKNYPIERGV